MKFHTLFVNQYNQIRSSKFQIKEDSRKLRNGNNYKCKKNLPSIFLLEIEVWNTKSKFNIHFKNYRKNLFEALSGNRCPTLCQRKVEGGFELHSNKIFSKLFEGMCWTVQYELWSLSCGCWARACSGLHLDPVLLLGNHFMLYLNLC